jgi:glutathione S-transferase
MKLYHSPPSPFSRKARIVASVLGLDERIELVVADTNNPDDALRAKNPLGKIPTLELDTGVCVYDSAVIVACLDQLAGGGKVIPRNGDARIAALTLEALADGVMDACILQIYEIRMRAENERSASWVAQQRAKVFRALAFLEADPPAEDFAQIGQIAVACALGYLDLRFDGAWRADHPRLVAWLDKFAAAIPGFEATKI